MTTKNTAQSLSVELLSKRINLLEEIKVLEETLKSRNINLPPLKPETVEKLSTYDNFIKDKINILEERKKELEALLPPQDQKMRKALLTAPVMPVMPNGMIASIKKKDKLEAEVEELRKQYPNVYLPQLKGASIVDVIQNLKDKKTILETAAALATPPTPPNNLMQDMTSPAPIGEEFLPERNPEDLYKKLLVVVDNNGHPKVIEALYHDEYSVKDAADNKTYSANQIIQNYAGVWPPQMRWQHDSPDDLEDKKTTILETAAAPATPPKPPTLPQRHMTNPAPMKVPDKFLPEQNPQDPYKNILDKADADKAAVKDAVEKAEKAVNESDPKIDLEALSKDIEKYKTALPDNPLYEFGKVIISLIQTLKDPNETNSKWRQYLLSDFRIALTHFKKRSDLTLLFNEIKEKYKTLNNGKDYESAVSIIEELKPWICDELYDYQELIKTMTSLQDLTLENIPDSNDYSHEFVRKKNDALVEKIQELKKSNALKKILPKTDLDRFVKEIQTEINREKCPVRRGGKTLRRRQMKPRTTVSREKGLRKRATVGQKKQKQTRTRN